eukprot:m.39784 g.39784  ORF g.39784 m.39784 type:complete len:393 (-) comp12699_c0_seq3:23-1201(-)
MDSSLQQLLQRLIYVNCTITSSEFGKRLDDADRGEPSSKRAKAPKQGISLRKLKDAWRNAFTTLTADYYEICGVRLTMSFNHNRDQQSFNRRVNQLFCKEGCQLIKDALRKLASRFQEAINSNDHTRAFEIGQWFLQTFSSDMAATVYSDFDLGSLYPIITARVFDNSANQVPKKPTYRALAILMRSIALSYHSVVDMNRRVTQNNGRSRCAPSFKERLPLERLPLGSEPATKLVNTLHAEVEDTFEISLCRRIEPLFVSDWTDLNDIAQMEDGREFLQGLLPPSAPQEAMTKMEDEIESLSTMLSSPSAAVLTETNLLLKEIDAMTATDYGADYGAAASSGQLTPTDMSLSGDMAFDYLDNVDVDVVDNSLLDISQLDADMIDAMLSAWKK